MFFVVILLRVHKYVVVILQMKEHHVLFLSGKASDYPVYSMK